MILETARLKLRPLEPRDASSLAMHLNNINITKWLSRRPFPYTMTDAEEWLAEAAASKTRLSLAIEDKESGGLIGDCSLIRITEESAGVGYWLALEYQGRGLATEVVRALIRYATESLHLKSLWATVFAENAASRNVLAKCGFRESISVPPAMKFSRADGLDKMNLQYDLDLSGLDST